MTVRSELSNTAGQQVSLVLYYRDEFAKVARKLHEALSEASIAALALAAIDPENYVLESASKYDGEVRELVAELADLFVIPAHANRSNEGETR